MDSTEINIRNANCNDLLSTWAWRNDSNTRFNSLTFKKVLMREYSVWYRKNLIDKNKFNYILFQAISMKKIAIVRFEENSRKKLVEVSINLCPKQRGKGLSKEILAISLKEFNNKYKYKIIAKIKKKNVASLKLFRSLGFFLERNKLTYFILRYNKLSK